jgi:hypothetical protein
MFSCLLWRYERLLVSRRLAPDCIFGMQSGVALSDAYEFVLIYFGRISACD